MKFAKSLQRNQVPEWSPFYLNYKSLKKLINQVNESRLERSVKAYPDEPRLQDLPPASESDLAPFFFSLDRDAESVDGFYNSKYAEYSRQLKHVVERYPPSALSSHNLDPEELEDLLGVLVELRSQLRKLQWYADVNKRGFVKILKKFDKKVGTQTQLQYLSSKISILQFANGGQLDEDLNTVNKYLTRISPYTRSSKDAAIDSKSSERIIESLDGSATPADSGTSDSGAVGEMKVAVTNDDVDALQELLSSGPKVPQKSLISLLSKSISTRSPRCLKLLLTQVTSLDEFSELNGRNVIHRLIINHGRARRAAEDTKDTKELKKGPSTVNFLHPAVVPKASTNLMKTHGSDGVNAKDDESILEYLLQSLDGNEHLYSAVVARDNHGRAPLHYAAHYGLKLMSSVLLKYIHKWGLVTGDLGITADEWLDNEGASPIELAVMGNHPQTAQILLRSGVYTSDAEAKKRLAHLVLLAARLGSLDLVEVLVEAGLDPNYHEAAVNNETALFIAAKLNFPDVVQLLVTSGADVEIPESTYGWTPIFVAAVDGYRQVCEILIKAGASVDRVDGSGWTAMEHACLRGHLALTEILRPIGPIVSWKKFLGADNSTPSLTSSDPELPPPTTQTAPMSPSISPVNDATSVVSSKHLAISEPQGTPPADSIKTFGHRYLSDQQMILVTLGTTDLRRMTNPVELERVPFSKAHSTQLDTALTLMVSASGCVGEPTAIDLPIPDYGMATEPLTFYTDDVANAKLYFDILPTYSGNAKKVVGRGVALLSSVYTSVGAKKRSLDETITIPIIESETLEVMGTVQFGFILISPFKHPKMGIEKSSTYWKSLITTRVIGHRGMGKNTSKKSLQLGENTLESFIQAANLGASYVEFDVQLTKDAVPVIYHDFLVGETGIDIPMHLLTLEQFLDASKPKGANTPTTKHNGQPSSRMPSPDARPRSRSLFVGYGEDEYDEMSERMKHTRDFKIKGFKGNSRGRSIQSPFTTLEEAFRTLPKHVGFNIECKYPMLDESEAEEMESFAFELNLWVDTVLKCVYDHADGRDIIFSSFHPDICLMLSLKQPSIPILFLTESGTSPMADVRASSLQEAVRFARRWNLLGVVSECTPLIQCPRLVNVVKASGLVCVTYGVSNNDPVNARLQMRSGVDAVIVDSVLAVRKGLTAEDGDKDVDSEESSVSPGSEAADPLSRSV